jgi:hypothetical protein
VLELSRLTQQSSFRHCNNLLETLWKQLPLIAKNMGKKCVASPLTVLLASLHGEICS